MDVKDAILKRRSVHKFTTKEVDADDIMELVDVARHAPSSGNLQPWKFILIKDENKKKNLADAAYQQMWISQASTIIVIAGMEEDLKRMYGARGENLYLVQDVALATQNILLRAVELGLSATFVRAFEEGMTRRVCSLPDTVRPLAIIAVGYSDGTPPKKLMKSLESMTYFESYGGRSDLDEAFYRWSGMMKKQANKTLEKMKKGSTLKDRIKEKFKRR